MLYRGIPYMLQTLLEIGLLSSEVDWDHFLDKKFEDALYKCSEVSETECVQCNNFYEAKALKIKSNQIIGLTCKLSSVRMTLMHKSIHHTFYLICKSIHHTWMVVH